jgi:hypothetical protein
VTLGSGISLADTTGSLSITSGGNISDTAASPIFVYGAGTFNAQGIIDIGNNTTPGSGNNFGPITLVTHSLTDPITYIEDGGVNLAQILEPGAYTGTITVQSLSGDIIENKAVANAVNNQILVQGLAYFTAANGAVNLNGTFAGAGNNVNLIKAPITIWAKNTSTFTQTAVAPELNGVTVTAGGLDVDTSGSVTPMAITENGTSTIWTYGNDTFNTNGAAVTLTNSGNNFGQINVNTLTAAPVSITEFGTSNWGTVKTWGGTFTATTQAGSEVETVAGSGIITGSGSSTITAAAGNIALTGSANNFGTSSVKLVTGGNASLTDTNGTGTTIGNGTDVTGNLTVTNTQAGAWVGDAGGSSSIIVGGTTDLTLSTSSASYIHFTGSANSIPWLEVQAGSGTSVFTDNVALNVSPGTLIVGPTTITASAITAGGTGPMAFDNGLTLDATGVTGGNILVSNTSFAVQSGLTVESAGNTDLSALSEATNLFGVAVVHSGVTGTYKAPGP